MSRAAGRTVLLATVSALVVAACDSLLGPSAPATVEINAERVRLDAPGDTITLEAVVRDDRGEALPDAAVTWESRSPEVAAIGPDGLLTAVSSGTSMVVARSDGVADSLEFTVDAVIPCAPVGALMAPDTVSGTIADGDCVVQGSTGDFWRVTLEAETEVTFELRSPELDAVLVLFDGRGDVIAVDDDGGIGLNSRIHEVLPAGDYFLFATTVFRGERGPYQLSAFEGGFPSPCPATASIGFPATVTSTVTADACSFGGFYIDVWRLSLDRDTTLILQLESDELRPGIEVTDTLGNPLAGSTIGPGDDAWLEIPLSAGSYDIWVGDAGTTRKTGAYTLSTRPGPSLLTCDTEGGIAAGQSVAGDLAEDDCFLFYGAADGWDLELEDSVTLDLTVRADGLSPSVLVSDPTGALLSYSEGGTDVARDEVMLGPGSYRVWARASYGRHGDYALSVTEAGRLPSCEPSGSLAPGDTVDDALAGSDCSLPDGRHADVWAMRLDSATTVTVAMTSGEVDAFLIVADSLGRTLGRDDDAGGNGDAALTITLEPGMHHLWATSYAAGETGAYRFSVVPAASAGAAARWDAPESAPRRGFDRWLPGSGHAPAWRSGPRSGIQKSAHPAMGVPRIIRHPGR